MNKNVLIILVSLMSLAVFAKEPVDSFEKDILTQCLSESSNKIDIRHKNAYCRCYSKFATKFYYLGIKEDQTIEQYKKNLTIAKDSCLKEHIDGKGIRK